MELKNVYIQIPLDLASQKMLAGLKSEMLVFLRNRVGELRFPSQLHATVCYLGDRTLEYVQELGQYICASIRVEENHGSNHSFHRIGTWNSSIDSHPYFLLQPHNPSHLIADIGQQLVGVNTKPHVSLFSLEGTDYSDELLQAITSQLKLIRDTTFEKPYMLQLDFSRLQIIGTFLGTKYILEEIDLYTGLSQDLLINIENMQT